LLVARPYRAEQQLETKSLRDNNCAPRQQYSDARSPEIWIYHPSASFYRGFPFDAKSGEQLRKTPFPQQTLGDACDTVGNGDISNATDGIAVVSRNDMVSMEVQRVRISKTT
jgi:hypothetical protein